MTKSMIDAVRDFIQRRHQAPKAPKAPKVRKPKTIKESRSKIAQAAWIVLNRRRGEAMTTRVVMASIKRTQPDLLKGDAKARYKVVHRALTRLEDVMRDKGRFWLPRRET